MENNIPCYRIDTNGMFHIDMLQAELLKQIRKINPSWVIYGSADIFYIFDKPLNEIIDLAETQGYNQIQSSCYGALNTGEGFGLPLYKYYKRGVYWKDLIMISKFNETFTFFNDHIEIENKNIYNPGGVLVNYGGCKPIDEQKVKLQRRQKAWNEGGLRLGSGRHFRKYEKINWTWDEKETLLFLESLHKELFDKLINGN
jgi:hypothetical protein